MLIWPDWNKLYADWNCLYYWVPFSDEQWRELDKMTNTADRENLVRKFREEYMKNRDLATGKLKEETPVVEETPVEEVAEEVTPTEEESIEDVTPTKKKGK